MPYSARRPEKKYPLLAIFRLALLKIDGSRPLQLNSTQQQHGCSGYRGRGLRGHAVRQVVSRAAASVQGTPRPRLAWEYRQLDRSREARSPPPSCRTYKDVEVSDISLVDYIAVHVSFSAGACGCRSGSCPPRLHRSRVCAWAAAAVALTHSPCLCSPRRASTRCTPPTRRAATLASASARPRYALARAVNAGLALFAVQRVPTFAHIPPLPSPSRAERAASSLGSCAGQPGPHPLTEPPRRPRRAVTCVPAWLSLPCRSAPSWSAWPSCS